MAPPRPTHLLLPMLAAAALAAPAFAQDLSQVDVSARAPTTVRVSIAGKDSSAVRDEVRVAARFVCRNAVKVSELSLEDLGWCSRTSATKAMRRYAAMTAAPTALAGFDGALTISAR